MYDRVSTYPGRVKLTPVQGQANVYDMVRADQPTNEGMPLSKSTLLPDSVAAKFGLDASAAPKDVLDFLGQYNMHWWKRKQYGSGFYSIVEQQMTGKTSSSFMTLYYSGGSNSVQMSSSVTINQETGEVELVDPVEVIFSSNDMFVGNMTGAAASLKGNYIRVVGGESGSSSRVVYKVAADARGSVIDDSDNSQYTGGVLYTSLKQLVVTPAVGSTSDWEYLKSTDPNAYQDGVVTTSESIKHQNIASEIQIVHNSEETNWVLYYSKTVTIVGGEVVMPVESATLLTSPINTTDINKLLSAAPVYFKLQQATVSSGNINGIYYLPKGSTAERKAGFGSNNPVTTTIAWAYNGGRQYFHLGAALNIPVIASKPVVESSTVDTRYMGVPYQKLISAVTEKIFEQTTTSAVTSIDLDVANLDLAKYQEVILYISSPGDKVTTDPALRYNGDTSISNYTGTWTSNKYGYHRLMDSTGAGAWNSRISFESLGSNRISVVWDSVRANGGGVQQYAGTWYGGNLSALQKITLFNSDSPTAISFAAGLRFELVGVLK